MLSKEELDGIAAMSQEERLRLLALIRQARALFGAQGMRMSADAVKAMTDVVDDKQMKDIVRDLRTVPEPGFFKAGEKVQRAKGTGWTKPVELGSPSGIRYIDQMCDAQDRIDKAERMKGFGSAGLGGPKVLTKDEAK